MFAGAEGSLVLSSDRTHEVEVGAVDQAGNVRLEAFETPPAASGPTTIPVENDSAGVVFDRWVSGYSTAYSGGGYVYSRWTGPNSRHASWARR